jgi:ABC-type nitrate/sulfonate/bicarbonate transport system substrate-binding protein
LNAPVIPEEICVSLPNPSSRTGSAIVQKKSRTAWTVIFCGFLMLVLPYRVQGQEPQKIRVAIPSFSVNAGSTLIPKAMGYWRDEGLDVDVIVIRATASLLALSAREVEFTTLGGGALLGILQGLPHRVVFTPYRRPNYALYAKPEIRSIQELEGKKLGVSSIGSGPDSLVRDLLKKRMGDSAKRVTILAVGGGGERLAALVTRSVDAAILSNPFTLMAKQDGYRELFSFIREKEYTDITVGTIAREELIKSNPAVVEKFIRGQVKALLLMQKNREKAVSILSTALKMTKDVVSPAYDELQPALTEDGTIKEDEQKKSLEHLIDRLNVKQVPPLNKIYDFSITRKVYKELEARGWKPSDQNY